MNVIAFDQVVIGNNDEEVFAHDASDESLEQIANPERHGAATFSFCTGLQVCPA
jgi:hypothetical protein